MEFVDLVAELGGEVEKFREGVQLWSGPLPMFGVAAVGIGNKGRRDHLCKSLFGLRSGSFIFLGVWRL